MGYFHLIVCNWKCTADALKGRFWSSSLWFEDCRRGSQYPTSSKFQEMVQTNWETHSRLAWCASFQPCKEIPRWSESSIHYRNYGSTQNHGLKQRSSSFGGFQKSWPWDISNLHIVGRTPYKVLGPLKIFIAATRNGILDIFQATKNSLPPSLVCCK